MHTPPVTPSSHPSSRSTHRSCVQSVYTLLSPKVWLQTHSMALDQHCTCYRTIISHQSLLFQSSLHTSHYGLERTLRHRTESRLLNTHITSPRHYSDSECVAPVHACFVLNQNNQGQPLLRIRACRATASAPSTTWPHFQLRTRRRRAEFRHKTTREDSGSAASIRMWKSLSPQLDPTSLRRMSSASSFQSRFQAVGVNTTSAKKTMVPSSRNAGGGLGLARGRSPTTTKVSNGAGAAFVAYANTHPRRYEVWHQFPSIATGIP
jgi:hypothetical protein